MAPITGKTRLTGIIGWPIAHSLSPVMHNAAFAALGLDWSFVPFAVPPERLAEAVTGLSALGVSGFNVTIPHKVAIMPLLDRITPEAELIGAVNVVDNRDGVMTGYNTDGIGLLAALNEGFGFEPAGKSVLVLGAGGAARAAAAALGSAGASRIALANRSLESAAGLARALEPRLPGTAFSVHGLAALAERSFLEDFDLIVNTTSVGMADDAFPGLSLAGLKPGLAVYDMVYAPPVTPLMKEAVACGVPNANGLGMLVAQGEAAFAIWTGRTPPTGCMARALAALPSPGNP
ncbi:shikimate dehydrogenase (NADP(+)) [Geomonas silvestris]|uniref:Shikimate dehydrogenase (NADP(+)) n=1 Tax=Geomonas silvestris TaxID=2740184 RepID=A0A6V8MDE7_9BACT|nr:shikimate dehydrogenase [Geomonas silvestris]GFO57962.1 shikimate dehydrogenase (NADP(+)) [Geomonas silvestris]